MNEVVVELSACELLHVEEKQWFLVAATGLSIYDFAFDRYFRCRRPLYRDGSVCAIARVGAVENYEAFFAAAQAEGITLVHTPEEHLRCSTLPGWYKSIEEHTARSVVFETFPSVDEVEALFRWPVFVKGVRQTARHQRSLSVLENREAFLRAAEQWNAEPILRWQSVAVREWLSLRPVEAPVTDRIRASFEFRAFVWRGTVVGFGPYWWEAPAYSCTESEQAEALRLVRWVARRVEVPLLVVDVAQCADGRWVVIECNDGQESGYAGVSPFALWQTMLG